MIFNLVGYKLVFLYADKSLDKQAEVSFDHNQYDEAATVIIKLPLNIPYQQEQTNFERADGKINVNGKVYRYIKRKIVNNEIILVCVSDDKATNLNINITDFYKTTSGLFDNNNSKKSGSINNVFNPLPVYNNGILLSYNFAIDKFLNTKTVMLSHSQLLTSFKEPPVQPPELS